MSDFLADDGNDSDSGDANTGDSDANSSDDASDDGSAQSGDNAGDTEEGDDGEGADDSQRDDAGKKPKKGQQPAEREPTALEKAIEAGDVRAFIAALGDKAETLLGGKAHKALRLQAQEISTNQRRLDAASKALHEKFRDPVAARKKWEAGDIDAFVDLVENQSGVPWADCVKAVNESQAGRETRLQSKAKAEQEKKAADDAKRSEHEKTLKTLITDTVKGSDAKLLEVDPEIVDDVFRIMQTGWKKGINSPAKALEALKKRLVAIAAVLAPAPASNRTPPRRGPSRGQIPQPRTPQARGKPPEDVDEMVDNFLKEEGWHGR